MERRPLATLRDIVDFTGLPPRTIYDQRHRGVGIGALAFKVGTQLRWDWDDVDAWVSQQKGQAAA
ncbi:hypothetical protein GCM10009535_40310 [Streptomyces thermocarboxydovorans]|uniref:Helix-turn-helix domain-containing protein n=1 Tax=Streptomyces thermocarboxydovorans TaxID=59298 RepID=A0ABP3SW67_9ACTN